METARPIAFPEKSRRRSSKLPEPLPASTIVSSPIDSSDVCSRIINKIQVLALDRPVVAASALVAIEKMLTRLLQGEEE